MQKITKQVKTIEEKIVAIKCDFCDAIISPQIYKTNRVCAGCGADICPFHSAEVIFELLDMGFGGGEGAYLCPICLPIFRKHQPKAQKVEEEFDSKMEKIKKEFKKDCQQAKKLRD